MPNNIGGKGFKKGKKKGNNFREEKELILKDPKESENYGLVKGAKGNGRFDIETPDGNVKLGVLAGKHRKRMWINAGDIVLVGIWEFQEEKCSILHKYSEDHVQKLVEKKEILPNFQKDKFSHFSHDEVEVDYFSTELPDEEQEIEESEEEKKDSSEEEEDFFVDVNDI